MMSFKSFVGISNVQPWLRPIYSKCRTESSNQRETPEGRSNQEGFPKGQAGKGRKTKVVGRRDLEHA